MRGARETFPLFAAADVPLSLTDDVPRLRENRRRRGGYMSADEFDNFAAFGPLFAGR